jgi:hypothetical protein
VSLLGNTSSQYGAARRDEMKSTYVVVSGPVVVAVVFVVAVVRVFAPAVIVDLNALSTYCPGGPFVAAEFIRVSRARTHTVRVVATPLRGLVDTEMTSVSPSWIAISLSQGEEEARGHTA